MERLVDYIMEIKTKCRVEAELSAPFPLTSREIALLCSLNPGEEVRGQELARRLGLSASRASRLVNSLADKKMLAWKSDNLDRRASRISLTGRGSEVCARIEEVKCGCEERLLSRLRKEDVTTVKKGLALLAAAL